MNLSLQADFTKLTKHLNRVQREQVPFAIAQTLNALATDTANAISVQMDQYFDRPTTFTKNAYISKRGFKGKYASKRNFEAILIPGEKQAKYLQFQIAGGTRLPKKTAILVPTRKAGLNRYGNISRANQEKIAEGSAPFIKLGRRDGKTPGVYKRRGKRIEPFAFYVDQADYRPLLPVSKIVTGIVKNRLQKQFEKALARALQTAR